ncbi:MAG: phage tail sheath C-terminal domain-containing protein [Leptolyngbyaceae bacterium]|nr:phage tail sheath C-terminal domain-containing protein [Leptolyngbyaceae bacterium]
MPRLDYFAPGVYVEEVQRGSRPIEGVQTAIAGFVGFTEDIRGGAELFKPMLVTSWSQYLHYFGRPMSDGFTDFDAYLPHSVYGWFLNGGGRCWVMSLGTQLPARPGQASPTTVDVTPVGTTLPSRSNRPSLTMSLRLMDAGSSDESEETTALAAPHGHGSLTVAGSALNILVQDGSPKDTAPPETIDTGEFFTVSIRRGNEELERFEHLSMQPDVEDEVADYVVTALEESEFIEAIHIDPTQGRPLSRRPSNGLYEVSPPASTPNARQFPREVHGNRDNRTGIRGLFEIDEITIVACPDLMKAYEANLLNLDQVHGVMELMVSLCEGAADGDIPNPPNRMIILDPPPDKVKPQDIASWLSEDFGRRSQFAALYYPWIQVANPRTGQPLLIPPSGHMAGIWSRNDETRGVYKAPANEVPRGVTGLAYECNFREQELLNPIGINCIRPFNNRGIRVWGARTLVEPDVTEWRYINVRRLISYIEKSIELGTQWVVFEPNDQDLWERVKRTVTNFLTGLWRQGALYGASPSQAFYVKCDAELNTPDTMILGRLYVEVGVCPVRPAEFVIFRVSQWTGQDEG